MAHEGTGAAPRHREQRRRSVVVKGGEENHFSVGGWTVMGDRTVGRKSTIKGIQVKAMGRDSNGTCILIVIRIEGDPAVSSGLHLWSRLSMGQSCKMIDMFG